MPGSIHYSDWSLRATQGDRKIAEAKRVAEIEMKEREKKAEFDAAVTRAINRITPPAGPPFDPNQ